MGGHLTPEHYTACKSSQINPLEALAHCASSKWQAGYLAAQRHVQSDTHSDVNNKSFTIWTAQIMYERLASYMVTA